MARGWESKSVEDQITDAEAKRLARQHPNLPPGEREKQERKASLMLSRAQIFDRLKSAKHPRYRAQLETALADIEAQLKDIE